MDSMISTDGVEGLGGAKRAFSMRILGLGGAGGKVARAAAARLAEVPVLAVDTCARDLEGLGTLPTGLIGRQSCRGLGSGGNLAAGALAGAEFVEPFLLFNRDCDLSVIVCGVGGGTGGGAAPPLLKAARESGALTLCLAITPFGFEGEARRQTAAAALHNLRQGADGVIVMSNQRLVPLIGEDGLALAALERSNALIVDLLEGLHGALARPGLIALDFAYLYSQLRGRGSENLFTVAEAGVSEPAEAIARRLAEHPFLEGEQTLHEAAQVFASISGGRDLTLRVIEGLMAEINERCRKCHPIMGVSVSPALDGRVRVTLVVARALPRPAEGDGSLMALPGAGELDTNFLLHPDAIRPPSRYVAPAPALSDEALERLRQQQASGDGQTLRKPAKLKQGQLKLTAVPKGRFDKASPTVVDGEDLDVPTFIRKGVQFN